MLCLDVGHEVHKRWRLFAFLRINGSDGAGDNCRLHIAPVITERLFLVVGFPLSYLPRSERVKHVIGVWIPQRKRQPEMPTPALGQSFPSE